MMREVGSGGIDLTDTDDLRAILSRLAAGTHTQGELEVLGRALQAGQIALATGERAVAVGGSVTDAVIVTGEGTVVFVFKGPDAETVQQAIRQVLFPVFTPTQIHQACQSITDCVSRELIGSQAVIPREQIRAQLDDFLASAVRYGLLLGPSGTGKSVIMAVEAQRLLDHGWVALLMHGKTFSLPYLAERVAQDGLRQPIAPDWRQVVVEPWKGELPDSLRGFVLMVDGIEANPDQTIPELLKLHNAVGGLPLGCFKIILSCRDLAWERLSQLLPFWQSTESLGQHVSGSVQVIEVTDFADEELDRALQTIGATELLAPREPGEWADPHVEAVRDLLKHPSTFGLYADLHASGDVASIQGLTWSWLIKQRVQKALHKAGGKCGINPVAMCQWLTELANLARQHKSRDFSLSTDVVKEALPDLEVDRLDPTQSPYSALAEEGILLESPAPYPKRLIGFRILDAGSYLLSFTLERQAEGKSVEELRDLATEWVREAYNYTPLLDAILAWIDRLADDPRDSRLLALLDVLVESHIFRTEIIFRLIRPAVIGSLFEAVREKDPHISYAYREAAKAVRPSPEALEEIRCHLHDRNPQSRQLATQLAGTHRDTKSISALIELLEDEEEDVRRAACLALGQIGKPAVAPLLAVLGDPSQSAICRRRCLDALCAVGLRDDQVSAVLGTCLRDGQLGDMSLLRSGLLTAAHLRDVEQTSYAMDALASQDWQVVRAAAKLLTEAPNPEAFSALREAVELWQSPQDGNERPRALRQLLAALVKMDKADVTEVVLNALREGLQGSGGLSPVEAISAAGSLGVPAAPPLILEDLVRRLEETSPAGPVWHSVRQLSATWQPDHLTALVKATRRLAEQGVDLAQNLMDAIIRAMRAEGDHPLRGHHAQVSALRALAKCQSPNFVTEAGRLLQQAGWSFALAACDALWVAGDLRAEEALLHTLEQVVPQDQSTWLAMSHVIRALGTCGAERGANAVLNYLRSEPAILIQMPEEAICPLVRRGHLKPDQLVQVVRDPQASSQGRRISAIALGMLNAPAHKDLFCEIIAQSEDTVLQAYAAQMLGFAQDPALIPSLQHLLRRTEDAFVAEQAAEALAQLNARQAVRDIEQALKEFAEIDRTSGFITALAHFREPSSLPVLIDTLERIRSLHIRNEAIEALGAFLPDSRAMQTLLERLETWRGGNIDMGGQRPAIRALAYYEPKFLLQRAYQLYNAGRLNRSARQELALWIPHLAQADSADETALLELLKRLVCDRYLPVREKSVQVLGRLESALCHQVYEELRNTPDVWSQACAVYTLGFWNSDEGEIRSARYADAFLIRHAADAALEMRHRRYALQQLVKQYRSADGLARLAAYLSIKEHGDEQAIWALRETVHEDDLAHTFLRQLIDDVTKRLQEERRKRGDEEQKLLASAGAIHFD